MRIHPTTAAGLALLAAALLPVLAPAAGDEEGTPRYRLERVWANDELEHQPAAHDVCIRDGWAYIAGGGGSRSKVSKVRLADGEIAWSIPGGSYQPSHPVSNGRVVVFGRYYEIRYVAVDDETGAARWTLDDFPGAMAAACFADDLVVVASYHASFYGVCAVDWKTGKTRWKAPVGEKIWSTPVTYGDLVLVGCYDGNLYAFRRASGEVAWQVDCGGRIASDPVLAGGLAFVAVDEQRVTEPYDAATVRKRLLVVDVAEHGEIASFETEGRWNMKIVASGDLVLFFDDSTLHAYDVSRRKQVWKVDAPPGVYPYPLLDEGHVILAMRGRPLDCMPGPRPALRCPVVVYDRRTGTKLSAYEDGGIALDYCAHAGYAQVGDLVLTVSRPAAGWRLVRE